MINNKQINILPVEYPELSNCYTTSAVPLSILKASNKDYMPWVCNSFIDIYSNPLKVANSLFQQGFTIEFNNSKVTSNLDYCPFIGVQRFEKETLMQLYSSNIIDCITKLIDLNHYVYLSVNQFYIRGSYGYQEFHFEHAMMVYGYDRDKKILYIADNFSGKFGFQQCTYQEFLDGFKTSDYKKDWMQGSICLLKLNEEVKHELHVPTIVELIQNYLSSHLILHPLVLKRIFQQAGIASGIDVYSQLCMYLKALLEGNSRADLRPFHLLWEHKKIMMARIQYFNEQGLIGDVKKLLDEYQEIEKMSLVHRNLILKYSLAQNVAVLHKMLADVDIIIEKEQRLLHHFLYLLERI